jgi:phosphoribosylamine--glycine ligase
MRVESRLGPRPALGVVMTAAGYPGALSQGRCHEGLPPHDEELGDERQIVPRRHGGNARMGHIVTHGGRVLCATALGGTVAEAQKSGLYHLVKRVHWDGVYYRTDIGYRAIARERGNIDMAISTQRNRWNWSVPPAIYPR